MPAIAAGLLDSTDQLSLNTPSSSSQAAAAAASDMSEFSAIFDCIVVDTPSPPKPVSQVDDDDVTESVEVS